MQRTLVPRRRLVKLAVAAIIATAVGGSPASAQAPAGEAQVKAAFVYNFLKFIEWPAGTFAGPQDSLIIGIVGKSATAKAAEEFLRGRQVNNRAVAVRRLTPDSLLSGIHALFVGDGDEALVDFFLEVATTGPVLSIGEGTRFATEGGVIGLLVEAHKVRFVINTEAADLAGLKVSSKLLALARLVTSTKPGHDAP